MKKLIILNDTNCVDELKLFVQSNQPSIHLICEDEQFNSLVEDIFENKQINLKKSSLIEIPTTESSVFISGNEILSILCHSNSSQIQTLNHGLIVSTLNCNDLKSSLINLDIVEISPNLFINLTKILWYSEGNNLITLENQETHHVDEAHQTLFRAILHEKFQQ